jgi:hypothetical protein
MSTNVTNNEAASRYELCSFVRHHIAEHPDQYAVLVPADRRRQFGLTAA